MTHTPMPTHLSPRSGCSLARGLVMPVVLAAALIGLAGASYGQGQSQNQSQGQSQTARDPRDPRGQGGRRFAPPAPTAVRRPLIDLEAQARHLRDGQIVPGQPNPNPNPRPAPAAAAVPPSAGPADDTLIDLPSSTPRPAPAASAPPAPPAPVEPAPAPTSPSEPIAAIAGGTDTLGSGPAAVDERSLAAVSPEGAPAVRDQRIEQEAPRPRRTPSASADAGGAGGSARARASEPLNLGRSDDVAALGPARARVLRVSGGPGVEWRAGDGGWMPIEPGASAAGRVEVRAGLDGDAELLVDDRLVVRVDRLARLSIELAQERDGTSSVHIALARGTVHLLPPPGGAPAIPGWSSALARVRTPDRDLVITRAGAVTYDAFTGARVRDAAP